MNARRGAVTVRYLVLVLLAAGVLVPFVSIVLASLQPSGTQLSGLALPSRVSWENFALAWNQGNFSRLMLSSVIIAVVVVPVAAACATLAGYALAVLRPMGSRAISLGFVLGLTLPGEVVVVALYFNLRNAGLTNSYVGVILAEVAMFMPFGVYWMQTHFAAMPSELVEAGRIDGARDLTVLLRLLLPNSWPALTTLAVLLFMWSWNQFLLILVVMQDPDLRTAPAGLGFFVGQYTTNIPLLSAASLLVIAPIVTVYLVFQRNFVTGVTQGAVK